MSLSTTQKLVLAFVTLILGVVLIGSVATQSLAVTDKKNAVAETYDLTTRGCYQGEWVNGTSDADCNITVTYAPTSWKQQDCPLTSVAAKNSTGTVLTLNTDYKLFDTIGIVQMLNTTATKNTSLGSVLLDYTYCRDDYMNSSFGRTGINLVSGMFGLALLLTAVGLFYSIVKEEGMF